MVEDVQGAVDEGDVAFGIDVGGDVEHDVVDGMDIDVFIDDDDHFGPGHLAGAPDGGHDFAGVVGVFLLDLDEGAGVEDAEHGKVVVDDVGDEDLQEREEDAFGGFAEVIVFLRGLADDGGGIDGIFAVGDGGDGEDGELSGEGVEAGVVAEGAFENGLAGIDVAFDDDFAVGGDFEGDGFAGDEIEPAAHEEAGEHVFVDAGGKGCGGGVGKDGFAAEGDGEGAFFTAGGPGAEVAGSVVVRVPVHGGGFGAEELDAVHAEVSGAGVGMFGDDLAEGDVLAAVFGPALDEGEFGEVSRVGEDDFLTEGAAAGGADFRHVGADFQEVDAFFDFIEKAGGDFRAGELGDFLGEVVEGIAAEGHVHAFVGTEGVDGEGEGRALDAVKEEGLVF